MNYFLRRSIATLVEFAETVRLLEQCTEFEVVRSHFSPEIAKYWDEASLSFRKEEHLLERVRNDIGGHFGQQAATYVVQNFDPAAVGKLELSSRGFRLHFVGEIAATAALRHVNGPTYESRSEQLVGTVKKAYRQATRATKCVVTCYLWERFGR